VGDEITQNSGVVGHIEKKGLKEPTKAKIRQPKKKWKKTREEKGQEKVGPRSR